MPNLSNVPTIFENTSAGLVGFDIYSRLMTERIIFLNGEIDDDYN